MAKYVISFATIPPVKAVTADTVIVIEPDGYVHVPEFEPEIEYVEVEANSMDEAIEIARKQHEEQQCHKNTP